MAYNYEYPYTDPHRHNDDWILGEIKKLKDKIAELEEKVPGISLSIPTLDRTNSTKLESFDYAIKDMEEKVKYWTNEKIESLTQSDIYALWNGLCGKSTYLTSFNIEKPLNNGMIRGYHWEHRIQNYAEDNETGAKTRVSNYENSHQRREEILIIQGQHGNEKANIVALYLLFENWMSKEDKLGTYLLDNFSFTIIPAVNGYGLDNNVRYNEKGQDINRGYFFGTHSTVPEGNTPWDSYWKPELYNARVDSYGSDVQEAHFKSAYQYMQNRTSQESYIIWKYIRNTYSDAKYFNTLFILDSHDFDYSKADNTGILTRSASNFPEIREMTLKYSNTLYEKSIEKYPQYDLSAGDTRVIRWNSNTSTTSATFMNTIAHNGFKCALIETPNNLNRYSKYDDASFHLALMNLTGWISMAAEYITTHKNQNTDIVDFAELGFWKHTEGAHLFGNIPASLDEVIDRMPFGSHIHEYITSEHPLRALMPDSLTGYIDIKKDYTFLSGDPLTQSKHALLEFIVTSDLRPHRLYSAIMKADAEGVYHVTDWEATQRNFYTNKGDIGTGALRIKNIFDKIPEAGGEAMLSIVDIDERDRPPISNGYITLRKTNDGQRLLEGQNTTFRYIGHLSASDDSVIWKGPVACTAYSPLHLGYPSGSTVSLVEFIEHMPTFSNAIVAGTSFTDVENTCSVMINKQGTTNNSVTVIKLLWNSNSKCDVWATNYNVLTNSAITDKWTKLSN